MGDGRQCLWIYYYARLPSLETAYYPRLASMKIPYWFLCLFFVGGKGRDLSWLVLVSFWLHLWLCPYTKVEESFNMQAAHDLLFYGPQVIILQPFSLYPLTLQSLQFFSRVFLKSSEYYQY